MQQIHAKPKEGYKVVSLKPRYRIVEIPEEWEVLKGEELFDLSSGISPSEIIFDNAGDTLYVQVDDMNFEENKREIVNSKLKFNLNNNPKIPIENEKSIVFPKRGAAILTNKVGILSKKSAVDTNIMCLKCKEALDTYFMFYTLLNLRLEQFMENAGVPQLNNKDLYPRYFVKPSLLEQQKIASILSSVDSLIQQTQKIIEQTQMLKKGLMQKLLTKGIGHDNFRKIKWHYGKEIEIPEEWKPTKIKEIGEAVGGGTPETGNEKYWNGDIPWAVPTDITALKTKFIDKTERNITEDGLDNSAAKLLPVETVLITSRATVGFCAINTVPMATNQGFQSLICNSDNDSVFMLYAIQFHRNLLLRLAHGTTYLEITNTNMEKVRFPVPPLPEQRKIAAILSSVDTTIEKQLSYKRCLENLKKGLMQKLLTGQIRVKV